MGIALPDSAAPPGQTPPEGHFIFQDSHGKAYRETLKRYTDMAPFSYDAASDPAYQAYKTREILCSPRMQKPPGLRPKPILQAYLLRPMYHRRRGLSIRPARAALRWSGG